MVKVVIIGAGILGLYAAYQLTKRNHDVTLLEKSDFLGGALRSYHIDGYDIEQFYHHVFTIDKDLLKFIKDLYIKNKILFKYTTNGFFYKNKIYRLLRPTDLLKFKPLPFRGKIGLVKFMVRTKLVKNPLKISKN